MKNKLNKKIISAIALLLTAGVIQISGGSIILVAILGGFGFSLLPRMFQLNNIQNEKTNYTVTTKNEEHSNDSLNYTLNNQEFSLNETNFYYNCIDFDNNKIVVVNEKNRNDEHISLIQEIETTPALTQQENINRLVRKKETKNRYKRINM